MAIILPKIHLGFGIKTSCIESHRKWKTGVLFILKGFRSKRILFFPEKPVPNTIIYQICHRNGYLISNQFTKKIDLIIYWEDKAVLDINKILKKSQKKDIININCCNVGKNYISMHFQEIFGYSVLVDPKTFNGYCVKKSDQNAKHDGQIIDCPIRMIEKGYSYQKLINNQINKFLVEDIRVPVFKKNIPFLYLKYRNTNDRFSNNNIEVKLSEVTLIFSDDELKKIHLFCNKIGLDYGELDILRDRENGKIYIVDANNSPSGPPNSLSFKDRKKSLNMLARTFEKTFFSFLE